MKRLIICCDGTWQSLDNAWPTNVQMVAQFILPSARDGTIQSLCYDAGLGLRTRLDRVTGGALGHGLDGEVREAYRFLCLNYELGDEIYLFGFSRGAYTVRSLAGLIYCCGILKRNKIRSIPRAMAMYRDRDIFPQHHEAVSFRQNNAIMDEDLVPKIDFLGCWDTVGALGVPDVVPLLPIDDWLGEKYKFHDLQIGSHILHARHAVAIDERRKVFDVTRMKPPSTPLPGHSLKEIWFPGDHGAVGGGDDDVRGLSDGALLWMVEEAKVLGLEFDDEQIAAYTAPNPLVDFPDRAGWLRDVTWQTHDRIGPDSADRLSATAIERRNQRHDYRPATLTRIFD